jgi:hypothetical protein
MKYLNKYKVFELKEWKTLKPFHPYGSKNIKISKIELVKICEFLGLNISNIKYIKSGKFGDAYQVDDLVLKITNDVREAKTAWGLITNNNKSIVNYRGVWRYEEFYVILMDKVETLIDHINKNFRYKDQFIYFCDDICDILYDKWGIKDFNEFNNEVISRWTLNTKFSKKFVKDIWSCYLNLIDFKRLDIHIGNIGISDDRIVLFDISPLNLRIKKFDDCPIIK